MPLILFGSALLMKLMERFPVVVTVGAGLLGWVAGEMIIGDIALKPWIEAHAQLAHVLDWAVPIAGALIVVGVGKMLGYSRRCTRPRRSPKAPEQGGQPLSDYKNGGALTSTYLQDEREADCSLK